MGRLFLSKRGTFCLIVLALAFSLVPMGYLPGPEWANLAKWITAIVVTGHTFTSAAETIANRDTRPVPPAIKAAPAAASFALVMSALLLVPACASSPAFRTMTGAFAACMNADLGAAVSIDGLTGDVVSVLSALVTRNVPALEADLTGLAVQLGPDAIHCAIAAVEAALTPPTATAATAATAAPLPGLVRLRAWAAAHPPSR